MQDPTDPLSKIARTILSLEPHAYRKLVPDGPGLTQARDILESTKPADLLDQSIRNPQEAQALLAGLWLWHDYLHESHAIAQKIDTPTGSFWHAIMHRREGDFANSKYWYARCADHPVLNTLAAHAGAVVHQLPADNGILKVVISGWNPNGFVDLVADVYRKPDDPRHEVAVRLQQLEWRILFEACARAAVA